MATSDYVDIPFTTDPQTLADNAVIDLQTARPGWVPNDGDQEVVVIETLAPMAANAASYASQMPDAALETFGTKMLGIPYEQGTPAYAIVTFTFVDGTGYTIPGGSQLEIDGYAFQLSADATIDPGSTLLAATVNSVELTAAANGLIGAVVSPISMPAFVVEMTVGGATVGGTDPQDESAYLGMIVDDLRLRAETLVSATDFELISLQQPGVGRAVIIANTARQVRVIATDFQGEPLPPAIKASLLAILTDPSKRLINITITVEDATYSDVSVTYTVHALPGYDPGDLIVRINAQLAITLSPASYGAPTAGDASAGVSWQNDPVLRQFQLIALIGNVVGVDYVASLAITGADGSGNLTMPGDVPLPSVGTLTGGTV